MRDVRLNLAIAAILAAGTASAGTVTLGFETSEANWYGTTSTDFHHSGNQSAQLSILSSSGYVTTSWVLTQYGLTFGQIQSIDYWAYKISPSEQAPYPLLYLRNPNGGSPLPVMANNPSVTSGQWVEMRADRSTFFHVEGDNTGLTNPSNITLGNIQGSSWDQSTSWASLPVKTLVLGLGMANNDGVPLTAYVDDVTITFNTADPTSTPEPATLAITGLACFALAVLRGKSILVR